MALDESRLSEKIVSIIDIIKENETDAEAVKQKFADDLAKVIVEEIKELTINYTAGLNVGSSPVTGTINATIS